MSYFKIVEKVNQNDLHSYHHESLLIFQANRVFSLIIFNVSGKRLKSKSFNGGIMHFYRSMLYSPTIPQSLELSTLAVSDFFLCLRRADAQTLHADVSLEPLYIYLNLSYILLYMEYVGSDFSRSKCFLCC